MKIAVLAGGTSTEREVSIVSGTQVCKALMSLGHDAVLADVFLGIDDKTYNDAFKEKCDVDAAVRYIRSFDDKVDGLKKSRKSFWGENILKLCDKADIVFLALHGSNGEDGRVQATFDLMGIKYTGSDYVSSAMAMDKSISKKLFGAKGIPMPKSTVISADEKPAYPSDIGLVYPVMVKPCCGGSSIGCTICWNDDDYAEGIRLAFSLEKNAVIEEYIEGREFSVAVVGKKAYPVIEIAPKTGYYDYINKYTEGNTVETCPAALDEAQTAEIQEIAVKAAEALGLGGCCRADILMRKSDSRFFVLELNSLPGLTPTSLIPQEFAAVGINYAELCQLIIDMALEKYQ